MTKAYSILEIKSVTEDNGERIITGTATTPKLDRDRDILEPMGAEFTLPMPFLWQHNHEEPIGWVEQATKTAQGITVVIRIANLDKEVGDKQSDLRDMIDDAWLAIKTKLVTGLSIGFSLKEYAWMDNGGLHITAYDLYEISAVTIASNPDGIITSIKQIKKAFADGASPIDSPALGANPSQTLQPTPSANASTAPVGVTTGQKTATETVKPSYVTLISPAKSTGGVKLL